MRIKTIEINNYKAFYKDYSLDVTGKNLFIYGENGSGKSSLYYALKDFFQSSNENIDFGSLENIFLTKRERGKGYVRVTFNPDKDGHNVDKTYSLNHSSKDTYLAGDTSIRDAISLKSFLTYKHLLAIHNVKKENEIDLFDLLVNGVLKHFKSVAVTNGMELGLLWVNVVTAIKKEVSRGTFTLRQKQREVNDAVRVFNRALGELFREQSAEYILHAANPILQQFNHGIQIQLTYTQAKPTTDYNAIENNHVRIKLKYLNREVSKPHLFLNEARLSAIAISIYLGMIKRHIQGNPCKILFLDDIFIGLDISNRLPLFEILRKEFAAYQIFITTYDKPWYEFIKFYLDQDPDWRCFEFFARRARKGFEIPIVKQQKSNSHVQDYIDKAEAFFNIADNKAAGVYLRSAFEFLLKRYCFKKELLVRFDLSVSKLDTDDFLNAIKKFKAAQPAKCGLTAATEASIEHYRKLVLNPLSHHDIDKHEITAEIAGAIAIVKTLKTELG